LTRLPLLLGVALYFPASACADSNPTFAKDGLAFLQKHCLDCHGEKKQKADLALHKYRDDASILKDRKTWEKVIRQVHAGEMPPTERPRPGASECESFLKSVKTIFDIADRNAKPDPGRVTVRRLNKVEYNNTVHDLVGIDFNASEDFPSDDVGHGFDNIGDVLTLPPILMERYLAAAESIVQRAILLNPPKAQDRWMSSKYLEPGMALPADLKFRPITSGNLNTPYHIVLSGDYTFRFVAYGKRKADEAIKVSVTIDGKEFKALEITSTDEKKPTVVEIPLHIDKGERRIAVNFINPSKKDDKGKKDDKDKKDDKEPRTLLVENFMLRGPMDSRPESQIKLLKCDTSKPKAEQTREVLTRFVSKAYRRPATTDEIDRLAKLVENVEKRGEKWEAGIQLAMQAVLVSPKFLFRVELDHRPDSKDAHPIDEYQLASRLSYFLWSTMPDQQLIDLAAKNQLAANLEAQVKRMLQDPRSKSLVDNFAMQWLQLRTLKNFAPDAKQFPSFDEQLRSAMLKETELFIAEIIKEDRSILDLIDGNYTFLNQRLANHYGIADTNGTWMGQKVKEPGGKPIPREEFVKVKLADGTRGGLLTQASILAVTSNPTRTSPVKRGRWVLEQLLGTPPPPPPPNVPELPTDGKAITSGSLRQRMELHRAKVACANCHAKMDAIGFSLENFNAIGAFRDKDGEFPIDPSGILPDGRTFKGAAELKQILKSQKDLFAHCLAEKMTIYAIGRGLEFYDKRSIDRIADQLAKNDYKFSTLVTEIVKSDPFRLRRGKE
jgi:hypothetical protein